MNHKKLSHHEAEELIRKASYPELNTTSQQRIKQTLLSEFANVVNARDDRQNEQEEKPSYHLLAQPMIPIIIALVMVVVGAGTAIASDSAKPGDALHGVDQALEDVRLNFTLSDTAKAEYMLERAQEREQERLELESEGKTEDVSEAEEHVDRILDNALETINRVRAEQEERGNENASETLGDVYEKLTELQERHQDRLQEHIQVEVKITNGRTVVEVRAPSIESNFTLSTDDVDQIVNEIVQRTGLTEEQVRAALKVEYEGNGANTNQGSEEGDDSPDAEGDDASNENSNTNSSNQNSNDNTNSSDDDNDNSNVNESEDNENDNSNNNTNDDAEDDDSNTNKDDSDVNGSAGIDAPVQVVAPKVTQ
ncbi:MAG: DUF5667 domain-containing protein [Parcubacteria group bacterium]